MRDMRWYSAEKINTIRACAALMLGAAIVSSFIGGGGTFTGDAPMLMGAHWFYIIQLLAFPVLGAAAGIVCADTRRALEIAKYRGILCFCCMTVMAFLQLPLLFGTREIQDINAPAAALFAGLFGAVTALAAAMWFSKLSKLTAIVLFVYFIYELYFVSACVILLINSIYVV